MSVFPSLFPFLIITNFLLVYDGISIYSKLFGRLLCTPLKLPVNCSFVVIVSALCGYPLGAKYACDLYEKNLITEKDCERLLNIASNTSPLFAIGAVGITMLKSASLGYLLLVSNYLSCLLMGILLPSIHSGSKNYRTVSDSMPKIITNFGGVLKDSIDIGIRTSLSIGGYITLFSVIIDIIKNNVMYNIVINKLSSKLLSKELLDGFFLGLIEITKGSYIIAASHTDLVAKIFIIGFFLGFSGLSIITQVYSFTFRFPQLSIKKYIRRKLLQGVLSGMISASGMVLLSSKLVSQPALSGPNKLNSVLSMWLILILLVPLIIHNIKKLLHIS